MKKSSQEIITALENYKEALGESFITFAEDIADSVVEVETPEPVEPDLSGYVTREEYTELEHKYQDTVQKYLDRFAGRGDASDIQKEKEEVVQFDLDDVVNALSQF